MKEIVLKMIPATITTFAVIVGIILDQRGLRRLEVSINRLGFGTDGISSNLEATRDSMAANIADFRREFTQDFTLLAELDSDISERLARLEERSS